MNHLNDYKTVPYVEGGRTMKGLDCWGLTRLVLHYIYNLPLFTSFGHVRSEHKAEFTGAYSLLAEEFELCAVKPGAVICGFTGCNLVHMGVCVDVDGEIHVLHTCKKHGASFVRVSVFKRLFSEVKVYEYAG